MLFYEDFGRNSYSVDIDEAMKRGNEALNASSLQFLRRVKRFIASSLRFYTQRQMLHRRYFLRKTIV